MGWTEEEEKELQRLTEKKQTHEESLRNDLNVIVDEFHYRGMDQFDLTSHLISRAEKIIIALKPFVKNEHI